MLRIATLAAATASLAALFSPQTSFAWKPTTHVYLAEIAAKDAADGTVSIPLLDGRVLNYRVDARVKDALSAKRAYYRAGVLGPDAYPDIMTGQQVIHPSSRDSRIPSGSDAWLNHVWSNFGRDGTVFN